LLRQAPFQIGASLVWTTTTSKIVLVRDSEDDKETTFTFYDISLSLSFPLFPLLLHERQKNTSGCNSLSAIQPHLPGESLPWPI